MSVKKIAIVGSGTAGYVGALILKTAIPTIEIDLISSKRIGIIGVGEGTTEHWDVFMKYVGINLTSLIKETDATFKAGIMFQGWSPDDYMNSVKSPYSDSTDQYNYMYAKLIGQGAKPKQMSSKIWWDSKVEAKWLHEAGKSSPVNQYHFNSLMLNTFLEKFAIQKGINIIDDEINEVLIDSKNNITGLIGVKKKYKSDFYIDCTGFKRLLISKLGAKWKSHKQYLKMKAAITFTTETPNIINTWTTAKAMDYGWMFSIPTYGRVGNGYIYDSDYISNDKAKKEIEKTLNQEVKINKEIKFDPGALDQCWINNCVAIGLCSSFIEPLEASSIGTSIQQVFLLANRLINYNEQTIAVYNKSVDSIIENIRDFVVLHYLTKKENTQFWKDVQNIKLPDSLQNKLDLWRFKLPIKEDFAFASEYTLFKPAHFILVMHGLNLFNKDSIRKEYEMNASLISFYNDWMLSKHNEIMTNTVAVPHRQIIEKIRSL